MSLFRPSFNNNKNSRNATFHSWCRSYYSAGRQAIKQNVEHKTTTSQKTCPSLLRKNMNFGGKKREKKVGK
jgi:hypothetical protein